MYCITDTNTTKSKLTKSLRACPENCFENRVMYTVSRLQSREFSLTVHRHNLTSCLLGFVMTNGYSVAQIHCTVAQLAMVMYITVVTAGIKSRAQTTEGARKRECCFKS